MSTPIKTEEYLLEDGVYRAAVAEIQSNIKSRFNDRDDLIRIGLDILHQPNGLRPRMWFTSTPQVRGRLAALIAVASGVKPLDELEVAAEDLKGLVGKEVNLVLVRVKTTNGRWLPRIMTFLPIDRS